MCHSFSLPDPNDTLTVYEGDTTDGRVVKIITGEGCFEDWIVTSNAALLVLRTDAFNFLAKFELSFKADGEDARCSFSNPLVFKQPSGLFSDGTSSLQEMWRSSVCSWIIQPMGNPERVTVYFNRLGIKSSGTLTIYDGFDTSPEGILYECSGCGQVAPPLLESFKGGFTIEIQSTSYPGSGQQDSWGFEVEYYSTRYGAGDRGTDLISGSMVSIVPPRDDVRGALLPRLPNQIYEWKVNPSGQSDDIWLSFAKLNIPCETSSGNTSPNVTVSPGTVLPCGSSLPLNWIWSPPPQAITLDAGGRRGEIEFGYLTTALTNGCGYPGNSANSTTTHPSFKIRSSNLWAKQGSTALDCTWFIEPNGASGWTGGFEAIDMRGGGVELLDSAGELIWGCEGCTVGPGKVSASSGGRIRYWSDGTETEASFVFFYYGLYGTGTYGLGNKAETVDVAYDTNMSLPLVAADSASSPAIEDYWMTIPAFGGELTFFPNTAELAQGTVISLFSGSAGERAFLTNITADQPMTTWIKVDSDLHLRASSSSPFTFKGMHHTDFPDDTSTRHCGMPFSSTTLSGPSFLFSDSSTFGALPHQTCTWRIRNAVITFARSNIVRGKLTVHDGDKLLYMCVDCLSHTPTSFVVGDGMVTYETGANMSSVIVRDDESTSQRQGFQAYYRSGVEVSGRPASEPKQQHL